MHQIHEKQNSPVANQQEIYTTRVMQGKGSQKDYHKIIVSVQSQDEKQLMKNQGAHTTGVEINTSPLVRD